MAYHHPLCQEKSGALVVCLRLPPVGLEMPPTPTFGLDTVRQPPLSWDSPRQQHAVEELTLDSPPD